MLKWTKFVGVMEPAKLGLGLGLIDGVSPTDSDGVGVGCADTDGGGVEELEGARDGDTDGVTGTLHCPLAGLQS